ncbi:MAG: hypothetical protein HY301_04505 [Verrucomicrobia bacterium]|nr:hypothetical protein [Verrucomicrobiota bacterium]
MKTLIHNSIAFSIVLLTSASVRGIEPITFTPPPQLVREWSLRPLGFEGTFLLSASFTNRLDTVTLQNDDEIRRAIDSATEWNHRFLGGATHAWSKPVLLTNLFGGEVAIHNSQNPTNDCDGLEFRYRLKDEEIVIRQTGGRWLLMLARPGIHERSAKELASIVTAAAAKYLPDFAGQEMVWSEQKASSFFFTAKMKEEPRIMDMDWRNGLVAAVTTNTLCLLSGKQLINPGPNKGAPLFSGKNWDYFWFSPKQDKRDDANSKPKPKEP